MGAGVQYGGLHPTTTKLAAACLCVVSYLRLLVATAGETSCESPHCVLLSSSCEADWIPWLWEWWETLELARAAMLVAEINLQSAAATTSVIRHKALHGTVRRLGWVGYMHEMSQVSVNLA